MAAQAPRRRAPSAMSSGEKGSDNSLTLVPLILLRRVQAGRIEYKFGQRAAKAAMNTLGQINTVRGAEQVEISSLIPVTHIGKTIEQRDLVRLRHHPHIIQIWRRGNHRLGTRTVL